MPLSPETEPAQGCQHLVTAAGKAGVDQHHAGVVGDDRPVHQVGMGEMDGVGDGYELHGHVSVYEPYPWCPDGIGVETKAWLN